MNDENTPPSEHNNGKGTAQVAEGKRGGRCGKGRKTFGCILGTPAHASRCFTEEVVHGLLDVIKGLIQEEERILDDKNLEAVVRGCRQPTREELPSLERAAIELTRINDSLIETTNQLPPPAELDKHLNIRDDLDTHLRSLARREESVWADRRRLPELRARIASHVVRDRASRPRGPRPPSDRPPRAERSLRGAPAAGTPPTNIYSPTPIEHHDVLVIAPLGVHSDEEFYRFPVIKGAVTDPSPPTARATGRGDAEEQVGEYLDPPELLDAFDQGQRRVLSVARPQDWGSAAVRGTQRGPAFSTLPLKPEPEPAAGNDSNVCYLINAQNLNFRNAWTAEEWNDTPGGVDLPPARGARHNEIEALLAGPQGRVFRLLIGDVARWQPGTTARVVATLTSDNGSVDERDLGTVESVRLNRHMEVWQQLRGGTAMGRVYFDDASDPRVVPLVNITTLTLD